MELKTRNVNTAFAQLVAMFQNRERSQLPITKTTSRNGDVLAFTEPVLVTYEQPLERVLFNVARDANPFFHLYEALWMLAGRNDMESVAYYASNMRNYSDDGRTLNGAYGDRWRHARAGGDRTFNQGETYLQPVTDQLSILVQHLRADPGSRRAVLQMWNVEDDLLRIGGVCPQCKGAGELPAPWNGPDAKEPCETCNGSKRWASKDVCCNLSVMFSLRDGPYDAPVGVPDNGCKYLDMTVTNRSNDLVWGMLGANVVHFSFLQEYMAAQLGAQVGVYHQFTNNLHVYESNYKPREWLAEYTGRNMHSPPKVEYGKLAMVPLFVDQDRTSLARFEEEVQNFVRLNSSSEQFEDGRLWSNHFLDKVAQPACDAWHLYKTDRLHLALAQCASIQADDWRIACTNWLQRRVDKRATKTSQQQG